ncbi:MAG: helix-turn-helix domain-containing protein [Verrucomicrobiales bacterium]|nr:helix-turn-helix domain-containing protein [Verrucomicrobiales bacterium]
MKEAQIPDSYAITHHFCDFDAFAAAADTWDIDFWQLDKGRFEAQLTHIVTPSVILAECKFNRKIEQKGAAPEGFRTFGIPADRALNLRWRGKPVGSDNLLLFPRGDQLDSVSNPGFHVFAFSVSEQRLTQSVDRRGLSSINELFPDTDLIQCTHTKLNHIRKLASQLANAVKSRQNLLEQPAFLNELEFDLVEKVLDAIITSDSIIETRPMAKVRSRALKNALTVIADHSNEALTLAEVERLSEASGRTLRYAFEEAFDISPKQYLQAYRLNQVRRLLLRPPVKNPIVADVANAWGFWHMGQFAADYRRMFGELPSTTISQ